MKGSLVGLRGQGGATAPTQGSPGLQESTEMPNSTQSSY